MTLYDSLPINYEILLDLQMLEGSGVITHDWAKPQHADPTLTGAPAWAVQNHVNVLDFDSTNPDFIEIAQADSVDLDFTSGDFSVGLWVYVDNLAGDNRVLFCRGLANTDGWFAYIDTAGAVHMVTAQAAAQQDTYTANGAIVISTWYHIVITRKDAIVMIFVNGEDATDTSGAHVDPLTSNRKMLIGILANETDDPFEGKIWDPRIWSRELGVDEIYKDYHNGKAHLGVA